MKDMKTRHGLHVLSFALIFAFACKTAPQPAEPLPLAVRQNETERAVSEAYGSKWIVSTQGRAASQAARAMLNQGGNLIDAAIAASFAISVERPQSTGLGGGGFLLYREAKTGKVYAIDFREHAPLKAREKMYLDKKGQVIPDRSVYGLYAIGVPGLVKGLVEIHDKFGKLPFEKTVAPAITLAENGFEAYPYFVTASKAELNVLKRYKSTAEIMLKDGKKPFELGEKIIQKDLAKTLREVARTKDRSFYTGSLARTIVNESNKLGKWLSLEDFRSYRVRWMEPVQGSFHGYQLFSMPPPSSGGTHVVQILKLFETLGGTEQEAFSPTYIHRLSSSMQVAFRDRARYMGDPDFTNVPVKQMVSDNYMNEVKAMWNADRAWTASELENRFSAFEESNDTTHFSIMDQEGNVVVSTQTINGWFGSGWVVPGTGIVMNNEMDDFSAKPGASNIFGAIGSKANAVAPKKTPLSSMSPTIVMKGDRPILAVGAPGGTRIINCVAQTILHYLNEEYPLYESVALPRIHHQWRPDELTIETADLFNRVHVELKKIGHTPKVGKVGCAVMAVSREGSRLHGVSDPRDFGMALGE